MKTWMIALLLMMSILPAVPAKAGVPVDSRIVQATVFSDRAMIRREATASVGTGPAELILEVETFAVDPDSVMARVFGEGEIYSVQYRESAVMEAPQETVRSLEARLDTLKKRRRELQDRKADLKSREGFLSAFVDFSKVQVPKDLQTRMPDTEALGKTLAFLAEGYRSLHSEGQAVDAGLEEVEKEIRVVEKELGAVRGGRDKTLRTVEIQFNSRKAQKVRIEAEYLSRAAGWGPLYKAAVPADLSEVDLTLFSKLFQKTGESWNQVALSVSTVTPLTGARIPTLQTWVLDVPRPQPRLARTFDGLSMKAAPAPMASAGAAVEEEAPAEEADFAAAERREVPLAFEYALPGRIDVESRDKETLLPLFSKKMASEFFHYAAPKANGLTFLVGRVQPDRELLGGMLNIYFGGQYVGKTVLEEQKAGGSFQIPLGADREVPVKREKLRDAVKETFFGKMERDTTVRELAYRITAENRKGRPVRLHVLDHLPVSRTDRIQVEVVRVSPEPAQKDVDGREGVLRWELALSPGEKKTIDLEFTVRYPRELSPPGFWWGPEPEALPPFPSTAFWTI